MDNMKNLSEPWFSLIKLGIKKTEGRLNKGYFSNVKKGDNIIFINKDFKQIRTCTIKVTSTHTYDTFEEYLEHETLEKCLPSIDTIKNGTKVYYQYFTKSDEQKYGIVAVRFIVLKK